MKYIKKFSVIRPNKKTEQFYTKESKGKKYNKFKIIRARTPWTDKEDDSIKSLVAKYGSKNWNLIATEMKSQILERGRTGKQCRERWNNHLNPNIKKSDWTENEESLLMINHLKYGNKWSEIANYLPGRSESCIKNHFYSKLRKYIRKILKVLTKDKRILQSYGIDKNKYNSEKIYSLVSILKIPYESLNIQMVWDLILKNEEIEIESVSGQKNRLLKSSDIDNNLEILKYPAGNFKIIINKSIFENIPNPDNLSINDNINTMMILDNLYDTNRYYNLNITQSSQKNYSTVNNYILSDNDINSSLNFTIYENFDNDNCFENTSSTQKNGLIKIISPLNKQTNLILPVLSNTNKSFMINFDNIMQKQDENEEINNETQLSNGLKRRNFFNFNTLNKVYYDKLHLHQNDNDLIDQNIQYADSSKVNSKSNQMNLTKTNDISYENNIIEDVRHDINTSKKSQKIKNKMIKIDVESISNLENSYNLFKAEPSPKNDNHRTNYDYNVNDFNSEISNFNLSINRPLINYCNSLNMPESNDIF